MRQFSPVVSVRHGSPKTTLGRADQEQVYRSPSHSRPWYARSSSACTASMPTSTATTTPLSASWASSPTSTPASSSMCSSSTSTTSPAARTIGAHWAIWWTACYAVTRPHILFLSRYSRIVGFLCMAAFGLMAEPGLGSGFGWQSMRDHGNWGFRLGDCMRCGAMESLGKRTSCRYYCEEIVKYMYC